MPVSGAGIKRLFNTARDICYYCRGRLNTITIQELIIFLCTSRFDIQEEQFKFLKEFFSYDKIEAANEERDDSPDQFDLDLISDDKEEDTQGQEETQRSKSPEDHDELDLPIIVGVDTQIRISGRVRKRVRREDSDYLYD